jgi:ribosomal protein L2
MTWHKLTPKSVTKGDGAWIGSESTQPSLETAFAKLRTASTPEGTTVHGVERSPGAMGAGLQHAKAGRPDLGVADREWVVSESCSLFAAR